MVEDARWEAEVGLDTLEVERMQTARQVVDTMCPGAELRLGVVPGIPGVGRPCSL